MLILPIQTIPVVEKLMIELYTNCKQVRHPLVGYNWEFSEVAQESLCILFQLPCIGGDMTINRLATAIHEYDIDFCESVKLA